MALPFNPVPKGLHGFDRADSFVLAVRVLARPVLVVREQAIIEAARAGALKPNDYAYFLASPDQIHALDALFASREGAG